jgi:hypothetical protein
MGSACSAYGEEEEFIQDFYEKVRMEEAIKEHKRKWENNAKMDLREIGWGWCGLDSSGSE